jgi:hypothetical protein
MTIVTMPLDKTVHIREGFFNRDPIIQDFFRNRASKEHKLHLSDTYVLVDDSDVSVVLGFFTILGSTILVDGIPSEYKKRLPDYPRISTILVGRMGRDFNLTKAGFGKIVLKEAMRSSLERGSFFALELYSKNESLTKYYERFGFIQLIDNNRHLILPYSTLAKAVIGGF